jgi:enoyl-[acyl-carrier protein] reductase II
VTPTGIKTRLTGLLGIRYPILLGGMAWIGNPELAAAVTDAGGLGVLGSSTMSPGELSAAVDRIREITDGPFGANISLVVEGGEQLADVAVEKKVPVVVVSGGRPDRLTGRLKDAGVKVLHTTSTARMAEKAAAAGVDAVVAEASEAAGHIGRDEIPLSVLVPLVREAVDVPVVAAGGIVCGRGMAAALALGADGVQIGTLFAVAEESPAHDKYKELVLAASERDPVVYARLEHPGRGLRTPAIEHLIKLDCSGASPEEIDRARGLGRAKKALLEGNQEEGIFPAGLGAARIRELKPVAEIVRCVVEEYLGVVKGLPHG